MESRLDIPWARLALAIAAALGLLLVACATAQGAAVTVRAGDTLSSIAARNGTSVAALARANGIRNPNLVRAGMRLTVPGAGGGAGAAGGGTYRVRPGDTLGGIAAAARHHGVRPRPGQRHPEPGAHRIGMRLAVPGGDPLRLRPRPGEATGCSRARRSGASRRATAPRSRRWPP